MSPTITLLFCFEKTLNYVKSLLSNGLKFLLFCKELEYSCYH